MHALGYAISLHLTDDALPLSLAVSLFFLSLSDVYILCWQDGVCPFFFCQTFCECILIPKSALLPILISKPQLRCAFVCKTFSQKTYAWKYIYIQTYICIYIINMRIYILYYIYRIYIFTYIYIYMTLATFSQKTCIWLYMYVYIHISYTSVYFYCISFIHFCVSWVASSLFRFLRTPSCLSRRLPACRLSLLALLVHSANTDA